MSQLTHFSLDSRSSGTALGCYYTTVYFLSTERNAYQYTWSCQYVWGNAYWNSLDAAKQCAERHRKQGTKFVIEEFPAIAFPYMKGRNSLVITERSTKSPLSDFKDLQFKTTRISDIARIFEPELGSTVFCLSGKSSESPQGVSLCNLFSKSHGGGYLLSWYPNSDNPSPIIKDSCISLAKRLNKQLKELK